MQSVPPSPRARSRAGGTLPAFARVCASTVSWPAMQRPRNCWDVHISTPLSGSLPPKRKRKASRNSAHASRRCGNRVYARIGPVPSGTQWIYVGDRGSDIFPFWQACQQLGYDFTIRVAQDRGVMGEEPEESSDPALLHLKSRARQLPAQDIRLLPLPATDSHPARDAVVEVSFEPVRIQPPIHNATAFRRQNCSCGWCASGSRCLLMGSSRLNGFC